MSNNGGCSFELRITDNYYIYLVTNNHILCFVKKLPYIQVFFRASQNHENG